MEKKFCTKCGNELDLEDEFCEKCGKAVKKIQKKRKNDECDIELNIKNIHIYGNPNGYTKTDIEILPKGKIVTVKVPNSINTECKLRLKGLGHKKADGTKGDVYLRFKKINYHFDIRDYKKNELKSLKCPNCGAMLDFDKDDIDICSCKYCKSTIYFYGMSDEAYRAKTKIKRMKHDEIMSDKKHKYSEEMVEKEYQHKKNEDERKFRMKIIKGGLIVLGMFLFYYFIIILPFSTMKKESIQQEEQLQLIVDEVKDLVEEEQFDEAYLKAKTIVYTEGWNSEIKEKWDEIRKEMIDYIIKEEKRVKGKSEDKAEKGGFFESFFN